MSNSSSSSNDSLLHPYIPSIDCDLPLYICCVTTTPSSFIFMAYTITIILLVLPVFIVIVYHGLQQRMQKRSSSSAAIMSHSDSFTYHMVSMELIGVFGCVLCCSGVYSDHFITLIAGCGLFSFTYNGQMFFHVLTCVERYLAVVHPITYLSLRKERGIRIRNISIGCVWLLCFVGTNLLIIDDVFVIVHFCLLIISLTIIFFCSLSVLRVLIRSGPGEQAGGREMVDQSKQRAFYTIVVILGVLVVRFSWNMVWAVVNMMERDGDCVTMTSCVWSNLLSSLVLPLLFLNRAGKVMCCTNNIQ